MPAHTIKAYLDGSPRATSIKTAIEIELTLIPRSVCSLFNAFQIILIKATQNRAPWLKRDSKYESKLNNILILNYINNKLGITYISKQRILGIPRDL